MGALHPYSVFRGARRAENPFDARRGSFAGGMRVLAGGPNKPAITALPGWLRWEGKQSCLAAAAQAKPRLGCQGKHADVSRICPCSRASAGGAMFKDLY